MALPKFIPFCLAAGWVAVSFKTEPESKDEVDQSSPYFLQLALDTSLRSNATDVVFFHIPYNFGHTVEKVAYLPQIQDPDERNLQYAEAEAIVQNVTVKVDQRLELLGKNMTGESRLWGGLWPPSQAVSEVTGCPLYFTPGKYWPEDMARNYFGDKQIFGILRDPYERLVAQFRGDIEGYGGSWGWHRDVCDVDGGIKEKMQQILAGQLGPFSEGCAFLPQAEYFDGPYGISVPVDNRYFAPSANKFLKDHGHGAMHIATADVLHVEGCNEVWAGTLSCETKALVRKVYKRDFELLCTTLGHCDVNENTCLEMVPDMCPFNLPAKELNGTYCA